MSYTQPPAAPPRSRRSREAGFGQLASSNSATDPDSESEQPCPSCGCFLERSDLALGVRAEKVHQEIICIAFLLHKFVLVCFVLGMSLFHILIFWCLVTFNVRKTPRKISTYSFWFIRWLLEKLNVFFSVLLWKNLWSFGMKISFPNF